MPFIGNIGAPELIIIAIIALVIFGPGKLPEVAQSLGRGVREFRKAASDVNDAASLDPAPPSPTATAPAPPVATMVAPPPNPAMAATPPATSAQADAPAAMPVVPATPATPVVPETPVAPAEPPQGDAGQPTA